MRILQSFDEILSIIPINYKDVHTISMGKENFDGFNYQEQCQIFKNICDKMKLFTLASFDSTRLFLRK